VSPIENGAKHDAARRAAWPALWLAAAAALAFVPAVGAGLLLVPLGALTPLLPAVPAGRPILRSRDLWYRVAAVAWAVGVLAGIVLFGRALAESEDIEAIATGMVLAFVPGVGALGLASLLVAGTAQLTPPADSGGPQAELPARDRWLRRGLLLALVAWFTWVVRPGARGLPFEPRDWLLHGPALLIVAGAALAFALVAGRAATRLVPVALATAGTFAGLLGLAQALLGMARLSIAQVTAGLESVTTACFATLVGLALAAVDTGGEEGGARTASYVAYAVFPLVSLLLLAVTFLMTITPMTKPL
jgi:hypothetical protein